MCYLSTCLAILRHESNLLKHANRVGLQTGTILPTFCAEHTHEHSHIGGHKGIALPLVLSFCSPLLSLHGEIHFSSLCHFMLRRDARHHLLHCYISACNFLSISGTAVIIMCLAVAVSNSLLRGTGADVISFARTEPKFEIDLDRSGTDVVSCLCFSH